MVFSDLNQSMTRDRQKCASLVTFQMAELNIELKSHVLTNNTLVDMKLCMILTIQIGHDHAQSAHGCITQTCAQVTVLIRYYTCLLFLCYDSTLLPARSPQVFLVSVISRTMVESFMIDHSDKILPLLRHLFLKPLPSVHISV